ncbi:MAG: 4Fe-4S binding protein [Phycisphaerae bacterium]|nr:4Fe-4S binding protein [Phycisphaerae bacterium]
MPRGGKGPGQGGRRGRWGRQAPRGRDGGGSTRGRWNRSTPDSRPPRGAETESPSPNHTDSASAELDALKGQARALEQELQRVQSRLATAPTPRSIAVVAVDGALCAGCGICASVCPNEAIVIERTAVIDPERCSGCGACVRQCPREAIRFL